MLGFEFIQSTGKLLRIYEHGRYRADQSAFRDELLGYGARPPPMCQAWQAREYAGFSPALACGSDARGAQNHLVDENVEDIDFALCAKADIVGITGMTVQRFRMTEILNELKGRGCFTVEIG